MMNRIDQGEFEVGLIEKLQELNCSKQIYTQSGSFILLFYLHCLITRDFLRIKSAGEWFFFCQIWDLQVFRLLPD